MTTPTEYVRPTRRQLIQRVKHLVQYNPSRHEQAVWIGSGFDYDTLGEEVPWRGVTLGEIAAYALQPVPDEPENETYLCGTTGCVAGWTVALGLDPRAKFFSDDFSVELTDGTVRAIPDLAAEILDLDSHQRSYLFSPSRTTDEIVKSLDALLEDPRADIEHLDQHKYTVTVTDANGRELITREVWVDVERLPSYADEYDRRYARTTEAGNALRDAADRQF